MRSVSIYSPQEQTFTYRPLAGAEEDAAPLWLPHPVKLRAHTVARASNRIRKRFILLLLYCRARARAFLWALSCRISRTLTMASRISTETKSSVETALISGLIRFRVIE